MSLALTASIAGFKAAIRTAFDNFTANLDAVDLAKLDKDNNFTPANGLTATTLAGAIAELKTMLDNLNATYSTDAEAAATIQAVNDAWASADSNLTNLINMKLNISAYTGANILAKLLEVDGVGSDLDAAKLAGIEASKYLTVDDTIDLGAIS